MDLLQRLDHGVAEPLGARDAQLCALGRLGTVERLTRDRVSQRGNRSPSIDLGLGPLGLEHVEDPRKLSDLPFVEIELVGEETQRASDTEVTAAVAIAVVRSRGAARLARVNVAPPPAMSPTTPALRSAAGRTLPLPRPTLRMSPHVAPATIR